MQSKPQAASSVLAAHGTICLLCRIAAKELLSFPNIAVCFLHIVFIQQIFDMFCNLLFILSHCICKTHSSAIKRARREMEQYLPAAQIFSIFQRPAFRSRRFTHQSSALRTMAFSRLAQRSLAASGGLSL